MTLFPCWVCTLCLTNAYSAKLHGTKTAIKTKRMTVKLYWPLCTLRCMLSGSFKPQKSFLGLSDTTGWLAFWNKSMAVYSGIDTVWQNADWQQCCNQSDMSYITWGDQRLKSFSTCQLSLWIKKAQMFFFPDVLLTTLKWYTCEILPYLAIL